MKVIIGICTAFAVLHCTKCVSTYEDDLLKEIKLSMDSNNEDFAKQYNYDPKIIGGTPVTKREDCPYIATLLWRDQFICGAVIINKENALTSASCVNALQAKDLTIAVGHVNLTEMWAPIESAIKVNISKVVKHESFTGSGTLDNNIALLHLSENLTLDDTTVGFLTLATVRPEDGTNNTVYGWGATGSGVASNVLNKVDVEIISDTVCNATYGGKITGNMLCTIGNLTDACQGDFGGPLVGLNTLVGIVSFPQNRTCGNPNLPRVYTDVTQYRTWIEENKQGEDKKSSANGLLLNVALLVFAGLFQLYK